MLEKIEKWENGCLVVKVVIDEEEYNQLVEDQKFLDALTAEGVDNWDGYEAAQARMEG